MAIQLKVRKGVPMKMDATDKPTFDEWFARVDRCVQKACGLGVDDLPDVDFMKMYEDRLRPIRAANRVLKYAQGD